MDYKNFYFDGSKKLDQYPTEIDLGKKKDLEDRLAAFTDDIGRYQERLFAEGKQALLLVFQGMDAAGKDSAIRAIFTGVNPQGLMEVAFKAPTKMEYRHDYLWRHYVALPPKGIIGLFNRSHYENVLVTRVHPEYILNENLPNISSVKQINEGFWKKRFQQILEFEETQVQTGTHIIKFMLNVSQKEQFKRFRDRLEKPEDNWKFSAADFQESKLWPEYMKAYEDMLMHTSIKDRPWYVIPADDKPSARIFMAEAILDKLKEMNPMYPQLTEEERAENEKALTELKKEEHVN